MDGKERCHGCRRVWPCPTVAALDASHRPEDTPQQTGGNVQAFAVDVARLVADYSNEERGVIALTPFTATLDQLCLEKYDFDLDKIAAPEGPEDTREETP